MLGLCRSLEAVLLRGLHQAPSPNVQQVSLRETTVVEEPIHAKSTPRCAIRGTCDPWVKQVPFLVQLPGLGVLSAMRILAAIGEISRFPSAKHLVGYAGLGASVHQSGETNRGGRITKEGRSDLRGIMVEAA
jgi:transposase